MRILLVVFLLSGCATQAGKDFYASCLESGVDESICKQGEDEINREKISSRIGNLGRVLSKTGERMKSNDSDRPSIINCRTRSVGDTQRHTCIEN